MVFYRREEITAKICLTQRYVACNNTFRQGLKPGGADSVRLSDVRPFFLEDVPYGGGYK